MSGLKNQLLWRLQIECLHTQPDVVQSLSKSFRTVFQPRAEIFAFVTNGFQRRIVTRAILPVVLIDLENMVHVESAAVEFPQSKGSSCSAVAICKRVNRLETVVQDCRTQHRRKLE